MSSKNDFNLTMWTFTVGGCISSASFLVSLCEEMSYPYEWKRENPHRSEKLRTMCHWWQLLKKLIYLTSPRRRRATDGISASMRRSVAKSASTRRPKSEESRPGIGRPMGFSKCPDTGRPVAWVGFRNGFQRSLLVNLHLLLFLPTLSWWKHMMI